MSLLKLYDRVSIKCGVPVVIHPQGFGYENIEGGEEGIDCYWVIVESDGQRSIKWLVGGIREIPEEDGPALLDCPLFFFELVPEVVNSEWRKSVKEFWFENGYKNGTLQIK